MQKINNLIVEPVINKKFKDKLIVHNELINNTPFYLCCIIGRKGSGKTSLLWSLLKLSCVKNKTIVRIFSSTFNIDETMINIIDKLNKYGVEVQTFDNIYDGKINILEQQFNELKENINDMKEEFKNKKKIYSKYIYIIDDLADILKDKSLQKIIFKHRHYLTSFIINTQYYKSLSVGIRTNSNILCLYSDIGYDTLKKIYEEKINSNKFSFNDFLYYYEQITKEKYNFMYINPDNLDIRKNLNYKLILE